MNIEAACKAFMAVMHDWADQVTTAMMGARPPKPPILPPKGCPQIETLPPKWWICPYCDSMVGIDVAKCPACGETNRNLPRQQEAKP